MDNLDGYTPLRQQIFIAMEQYVKMIPNLKELSVLDIGIEGDPKPSGNFKFFGGAKEFKTADVLDKLEPDFVDDISRSQFPDNYWDVVICSQVIEHVWDFEGAFKHLYRIVKPGGYLILDCPWKCDWHPTNDTPDYWRFSPDVFKKYFPQKKMISMDPNGYLITMFLKKEA